MNKRILLLSLFAALLVLLVSVAPLAAQEATQEATSETITCEAGFRLFDHEYLTTDPVCIPEHPESVAITNYIDVVSFLRADIDVVGATFMEFVAPQFPNWAEEISHVSDLGYPPNLETLLSLEPDLILANDFIEVEYEVFADIAPTLVYTLPPDSEWKERAAFFYDVAGELDAYNALLAEYEARFSELRTLIENPEAIEVSLVLIGEDMLRVYSQYNGGGSVLADIGFSRPEAQILPVTPEELLANPDAYPSWEGWFGFVNISRERLDLADGDFIIFFNPSSQPEDILKLVEGDALLQQLEPVQSGEYFVTNANFAGTDLASAHFLLDVIAEAFGVAEEFSPNPYVVKAPIPEPGVEATETASN